MDATATDITTYQWNNDNRLVTVTVNGVEVDYSYDPFGRMVARTDVAAYATQFYVYDGQNVVLVLQQFGSVGFVTERNLYGPAVDQVLASEEVAIPPWYTYPQLEGRVNWYLTDNQGTVRDVVEGCGAYTSVADHLVYDACGQITSQTPGRLPSRRSPMTACGTIRPAALTTTLRGGTNPANGVFISQDPIGFGGGQTNLSEYCGNSPTNAIDPSGLSSAEEGFRARVWLVYHTTRNWKHAAKFNADGTLSRSYLHMIGVCAASGGGGEIPIRGPVDMGLVASLVANNGRNAGGAAPDVSWWGATGNGLLVGLRAGNDNGGVWIEKGLNWLGFVSDQQLAQDNRSAKWWWDQVYSPNDTGGKVANATAAIGRRGLRGSRAGRLSSRRDHADWQHDAQRDRQRRLGICVRGRRGIANAPRAGRAQRG